MTQTISLFPLSAVLLPYGKIPLRIFEARYLDLVKHSLKNDEPFGIVLLQSGREVSQAKQTVQVEAIGTLAKIVDWDQMDDGKLGITVEGQQSFEIIERWQENNKLHKATVKLIDLPEQEPIVDEFQELNGLLEKLAEHPEIARLHLNLPCTHADQLGAMLTQLLPLAEELKYELLVMSPLERLDTLLEILDDLAE